MTAVLVAVAQTYLGLMFLGAAWGTWRAEQGTWRQARTRWSARALSVAELAGGFLLLSGELGRIAALAAAAFLGIGAATKAVRRARDPGATCGCLGTPRRIDAGELVATTLQCGAALLVATLADPSPAGARVVAGIVVGATYLVAAAVTGGHRRSPVPVDLGSQRSS